MGRLAVFTEAGWKKGMGHFVRTSGICDYCEKMGHTVDMYLDSDGMVDTLVKKNYVRLSHWTNNKASLGLIDSDTVVLVDSYTVDLSFLHQCNEICRQLIVIDDNMRINYDNMTILNPNYFAESLDYPEQRNNVYYLGKDYTLLREPFYKPFERTIKQEVSDVLITMGGTDVLGLTDKVIQVIHKLKKNIRLHVVATNAFQNLDEIKKALKDEDKLYLEIDAESMYNLMLKVDFAVASAGGTSNELIRTQCPTAYFVVANNQTLNAKYLTENRLAFIISKNELDTIQQLFSYEIRYNIWEKLLKFTSEKRAITEIVQLLDDSSKS